MSGGYHNGRYLGGPGFEGLDVATTDHGGRRAGGETGVATICEISRRTSSGKSRGPRTGVQGGPGDPRHPALLRSSRPTAHPRKCGRRRSSWWAAVVRPFETRRALGGSAAVGATAIQHLRVHIHTRTGTVGPFWAVDAKGTAVLPRVLVLAPSRLKPRGATKPRRRTLVHAVRGDLMPRSFSRALLLLTLSFLLAAPAAYAVSLHDIIRLAKNRYRDQQIISIIEATDSRFELDARRAVRPSPADHSRRTNGGQATAEVRRDAPSPKNF